MSLKKNAIDFLEDTGLLRFITTGLLLADVLTEIQIKQKKNLSAVVTQIPLHFSYQFNLNENK